MRVHSAVVVGVGLLGSRLGQGFSSHRGFNKEPRKSRYVACGFAGLGLLAAGAARERAAVTRSAWRAAAARGAGRWVNSSLRHAGWARWAGVWCGGEETKRTTTQVHPPHTPTRGFFIFAKPHDFVTPQVGFLDLAPTKLPTWPFLGFMAGFPLLLPPAAKINATAPLKAIGFPALKQKKSLF